MTGRHATRLHLFARETAKLFCGTFLLRLNLCQNRCPSDSASNMRCCALMVTRQCSKDCTVRTLSCVVIHSSRLFCVRPHPIPPARSELCCRFCVFEWLLAHHLARPLRQESVLVESGGSMVCASKKPVVTTDSKTLSVRVWARQACTLRTGIPFFKLSAVCPKESFCWTRRGRVSRKLFG